MRKFAPNESFGFYKSIPYATNRTMITRHSPHSKDNRLPSHIDKLFALEQSLPDSSRPVEDSPYPEPAKRGTYMGYAMNQIIQR
jgi:hypothetical protein